MNKPSASHGPASVPLAITGIGCRLPAGIEDSAALWSFLRRGGDAIRPVPPDRWSARRFYDANPGRAAKTYSPEAGFLDELPMRFDATVFGLSPREAAHLDPQQRMLLETTWEACENAGQPIDQLRGSTTGVFMGGFTLDMMIMLLSPLNRELISNHTATAATMTMLANRISYVFDLHGPSITCDTACSSSLTAFHLACQSVWSGECERAIVGGANVMLRPEFPIAMSKGRFLAADGRCKTFDARADGYGRGEGAAVVIVKPLAEAQRDGDRIYAVVHGTGVNQDGQTPGITLPNRESQEQLMRDVYAKSGIDPHRIHYVEAHGTGTQAGDTAEAGAIGAVLGGDRPKDQPLLVGSVKTNFGHLEAGAGILGIIKTALCLHHREVPPHLHFETPNPAIPFDRWGLRIPTTTHSLPADCLAAVNSFGYGGSNAHIVLGTTPASPPPEEPHTLSPATAGPDTQTPPPSKLFPFSARSPEALQALALSLHDWLDGPGKATQLDNLAYTLTDRRSHHDYRISIVARDLQELQTGLAAHGRGDPRPGLTSGQVVAPDERGPVFVYTGMGPQWWAMGRELWHEESVFRDGIEAIEELFAPMAGWSLRDAMLASEAESRMTETAVAQPANFALQYALTLLWESWGIKPAAVVGHSVGEITAAAVSGSLSLTDAVAVVYHRSRLQASLEGQGRMLATNLTPTEATDIVTGLSGLVSLAAINSDTSTVLAGDAAALDELAQGLTESGHDAKFLRVEVAYHSHQMEPLQAPLCDALKDLVPQVPDIPLYSTMSGARVVGANHDAHYWWQNLRQTVRFGEAVTALTDAGHRTYVEIGPHPVLGGSLRENLATCGVEGAFFFSLKRKEPEAVTLRDALGALHVRGMSPHWSVLNQSAHGQLLDLPNYPWQRELLWIESEASRQDRIGSDGPALLGDRRFSAGYQREIRLTSQSLPWLDDHQVEGATVFPAAGYVDAMVSAARDILPDQDSLTFESVAFHHLLVLSPNEDSVLQFDYDETTGESRLEGARAGQTDAWQLHASSRLVRGEINTPPPPIDPTALSLEFPTEVSPEAIYSALATRQLDYGPAFRRLVGLRRRPGAALAKLSFQPDDEQHELHPGLLDGAFQAMLGALDPTGTGTGAAMVPTSVDRITWYAAPRTECIALVELTETTPLSLRGNVQFFDQAGHLLLDLRGIRCQALSSGEKIDDRPEAYVESWEPNELEPPEPLTGKTIIIGHGETAERLAELISATGGHAEICSDFENPDLFSDATTLWDTRAFANTQGDEATNVAQRCYETGRFWAILATLSSPPRVVVLTTGTQPVDGAPVDRPLNAGLWGLARVARLEHPNFDLRLIDLDRDPASLPLAITVTGSAQNENEIAVRQGRTFVRRIAAAEEITPPNPEPADENTPCKLEIGEAGLISSLHFRATARPLPGPGEVEVRVQCAGLNFKDSLKVLGTIDEKVLAGTFFGTELGMEYSGTVSATGPDIDTFKVGDSVYGSARNGSMCSHLLLDPDKDVLFHERATPGVLRVPQFVAAVTVWRGLKEAAGLAAGERVLIHSATGAVGLYAISYAQSVGAEIFATAGSAAKRDYLRTLGVKHVYNSRTLAFADAIRHDTGGKGVDVVLNALAGEFLRQSFALLAPYGRFIEIGKQDIIANTGLPLAGFNHNLTFAAIDIDRLLVERRSEFIRVLEETNTARDHRILRDPPTKVFPAREAAAAFQLLAQTKHIGKVAIELDLTDTSVHPAGNTLVHSDGTYLVTGGLDGFGAETARWLATHGAGSIVLAGRRGASTPGAKELVRSIETAGAKVEVVALDVSDQNEVTALVQRLATAPQPLRGIFHAAGVLIDRPMADLTSTDYAEVFAPKVNGATALDAATRELELDHFVLFSSVTAVTGNPGQANYAAANSILDAIAAQRRSLGLAATSINWGAIARVGMAARNTQIAHHLEAIGLRGIEPLNALTAWSERTATAPDRIMLVDINWNRWIESHSGMTNAPMLTHVRAQSVNPTPAGTALPPGFTQLAVTAQRIIIERVVREQSAFVLKTAPDRVQGNRPFSQLGVDSLMEIELRIALGKALGVEMSRMDFARAATLDAVTSEFANRLGLNLSAEDSDVDIETLSGPELDTLLQSLENADQPKS